MSHMLDKDRPAILASEQYQNVWLSSSSDLKSVEFDYDTKVLLAEEFSKGEESIPSTPEIKRAKLIRASNTFHQSGGLLSDPKPLLMGKECIMGRPRPTALKLAVSSNSKISSRTPPAVIRG
ncbi:hypothetical protein PPACK8108_LOCUS6222, partial [Phakopsora pachyrhizi]